MKIEPTPIYDRIVMNPPFLKQADIHHVNHALKFLRPDTGLLVSVMSAGVSFRVNNLTTSFRQLVAERGGASNACRKARLEIRGPASTLSWFRSRLNALNRSARREVA